MINEITCGAVDARCLDLEWAADNVSICPGSPTITGLRVAPSSGEVEVAQKYPFAAYLTFSDGQEKNVTTKATWKSSNSGVASVDTAGVCTGVAVGIVTIEASYRTYFDFGQLTVLTQCIQVGMDMVLVFDRSASMLTPGLDGATRLAQAQAAARGLIENVQFTKDKVAVVSFAGIYETSAAGVLTRYSHVTEHLVLSQSKEDVLAAIDAISVGEPCLYDLADGGRGNRCATGLGGGLQAAKDELTSARARVNSKKVVALLTDGVENICSPDPVTVSASMKALNWIIVVVAVNVPDTSLSVCGGAGTTAWTYLASLTTCNLFFTADDAGELTDIYARIPSIICKNQANGCFYYFQPPTSNPADPGRTRDQLDYDGFINFKVTDGFVDLIGIDIWPDLAPGRGLIVDLVGTHLSQPDVALKEPWGRMESKQNFQFSPGRYRLTVTLSGNMRQPGRVDRVNFSIGGMIDFKHVEYQWDHPMYDIVQDFSVVAATAHPLVIQHDATDVGANPTLGILLASVQLKNLDTGVVLLTDSFDEENPI